MGLAWGWGGGGFIRAGTRAEGEVYRLISGRSYLSTSLVIWGESAHRDLQPANPPMAATTDHAFETGRAWGPEFPRPKGFGCSCEALGGAVVPQRIAQKAARGAAYRVRIGLPLCRGAYDAIGRGRF